MHRITSKKTISTFSVENVYLSAVAVSVLVLCENAEENRVEYSYVELQINDTVFRKYTLDISAHVSKLQFFYKKK